MGRTHESWPWWLLLQGGGQHQIRDTHRGRTPLLMVHRNRILVGYTCRRAPGAAAGNLWEPVAQLTSIGRRVEKSHRYRSPRTADLMAVKRLILSSLTRSSQEEGEFHLGTLLPSKTRPAVTRRSLAATVWGLLRPEAFYSVSLFSFALIAQKDCELDLRFEIPRFCLIVGSSELGRAG